MRIGIVVVLPSDVDRFLPVLRRLSGADFVVPSARWPHASIDSRAWTLQCVRRGGDIARVEPEEAFDLLLLARDLSPEMIRGWLSPRGRLALWGGESGFSRLGLGGSDGLSLSDRDGSVAMTPPSCQIAFSCASHPESLPRGGSWPRLVTGDPLSEGFFDVGAGARARAALGLATSAERRRPTLLLLLERPDGAISRWATRLARLRVDADLVLAPSARLLLDAEYVHPRPLTGPGLRLRTPGDLPRLADLLAATDVVLAEPGTRARLAFELGVPTALVVDDPGELRRRPGQSPEPGAQGLDDLLVLRDSHELDEGLAELLHQDRPSGHRERHREAAQQLADRLTAATQLLVR